MKICVLYGNGLGPLYFALDYLQIVPSKITSKGKGQNFCVQGSGGDVPPIPCAYIHK